MLFDNGGGSLCHKALIIELSAEEVDILLNLCAFLVKTCKFLLLVNKVLFVV